MHSLIQLLCQQKRTTSERNVELYLEFLFHCIAVKQEEWHTRILMMMILTINTNTDTNTDNYTDTTTTTTTTTANNNNNNNNNN